MLRLGSPPGLSGYPGTRSVPSQSLAAHRGTVAEARLASRRQAGFQEHGLTQAVRLGKSLSLQKLEL